VHINEIEFLLLLNILETKLIFFGRLNSTLFPIWLF